MEKFLKLLEEIMARTIKPQKKLRMLQDAIDKQRAKHDSSREDQDA